MSAVRRTVDLGDVQTFLANDTMVDGFAQEAEVPETNDNIKEMAKWAREQVSVHRTSYVCVSTTSQRTRALTLLFCRVSGCECLSSLSCALCLLSSPHFTLSLRL